jgi:Protein of unknown function (DUF3048) N-terminal domain/Protein of unknown function (DUF3048) C-terminal domain
MKLGAVGNRKLFRATLSFSAIAAIASLTACSANIPGLPAASPTPEPVYISAPLTGAQYLEGSPEALALATPSVACKIDNSFAARPQQNLNLTDVVFDEMVEGGLTRLVAIWHSQLAATDTGAPATTGVGPVRSIRPMDPDIISPFGGIVCYSGGQQKFVNMMRDTVVFNASETTEQGNGTFRRSKDRVAPHNVIVNVKLLSANHADPAGKDYRPAPQQMFDFATTLEGSTAAATGNPVARIKVAFPSALAEWVPSADGKTWLRIQDGAKHLDSATKEQLRATNVIVMDVKEDRSYGDPKYGHIPKAVMIGKGRAWVFTGGKYIDAFWSKADKNAKIIFTDAAGAAINLAPGNTWIELKPADPEGKLTIVAGTAPTPSPTSTK